MAKRIYTPPKTERTPVEEPWMVVGGPGSPREGRPLYLLSEMGIDEAEARRLASRLQNAVAVQRNGAGL